MQDSKFADIYFSEISSFIFKVPVEKVFIDEEELHGIDVGELTRNIAKKKKPGVLQAYKHPLCDICQSIFSKSMWNILDQLGKHNFSCG